MSCVVGVKNLNGIFMGADSAVVTDDHKGYIKEAKLFRKGDFIVGGAGLVKGISLVRYQKWPELGDMHIEEYMHNVLSHWIMRKFLKHKIATVEDEAITSPTDFIVGYKDRLFSIDSAFGVTETARDYVAIGAGYPYALGSLYSSKEINVKAKTHIALAAASEFSINVYSPFIFLSTYEQVDQN